MSSWFELSKPAPLKPGDTVAIAAPASCFDREAFLLGVEKIKGWGFQVRYREDIFSKKRYLAGEDARRLEELLSYLEDPQVKAIFAARGGYGSLRLLESLNHKPKPTHAKILLGYSDITSLLLFAFQRWGWVTFQGPVVAKDIGGNLKQAGEASLLRVLTDPRPLGELKPKGLQRLYSGKARGRLVGGCLSLLVCSLGTPFQIQSQDGLLYLEDVGEKLYSLDRMLTHLRLAGVFHGVKGIVFGPLKDTHDKEEVIVDMLRDVLGDLQIPMVFGFPCGHTEDSWTLPMGLEVGLNADELSLTFSEGALEE